jgi:uncharacterized protein YneF (UPF0154 family)
MIKVQHPPNDNARPSMEIAILVILFLVGSVGGAVQALKYVERRREQQQRKGKPPVNPHSGQD